VPGRIRVKICGITRPEDARAAARAGADAIGLVFWPPSSRAIDEARAVQVVRALPAFVTVVGLFVDAGSERVREVAEAVPLDLVQYHGSESPEECAAGGLPYIRAVRMRAGTDLAAEARRFAAARGLLLDSWSAHLPGGSGRPFDWDLVGGEVGVPLILAGGLDADNVGEAIARVRPWAVDVSSGVEAAPGVKDAGRIERFVSEVERAGSEQSQPR